jgi:uncharacterized membrane protein YgdD (TMEM256/DUF423 family)
MKTASIAVVGMLLAVACGAFGAHALRDHLSPPDMAIWEKAVLYQLTHCLAVLVVALVGPLYIPACKTRFIATLFLTSVVIFSGSLYILVLTNTRWLGMITPLGGSGFMLAWGLLAVFLWRSKGLSKP